MQSPIDLDAYVDDPDKFAEMVDDAIVRKGGRVAEVWLRLADADRFEISRAVSLWLLR